VTSLQDVLPNLSIKPSVDWIDAVKHILGRRALQSYDCSGITNEERHHLIDQFYAESQSRDGDRPDTILNMQTRRRLDRFDDGLNRKKRRT
jgi:hypothetical protein